MNIDYQINYINGSVTYIHPLSEEAKKIKLAQFTLPEDGQTSLHNTKEELKAQNQFLANISTRNYKNTYLIPVEASVVLLNLIPQKLHILDSDISRIIDNSFSYFTEAEEVDISPEPFTIADGLFFRYVEGSPKPIDQYTYYLMDDGVIKQIPNFKTLEVMLFERNQTYNHVRVIEKSQFNDLLSQSDMTISSDKSSMWSPEMEDQTNFGKYLDLLSAAKSGSEIAGAAAAEADKNLKTMKAEKDAEKAKADQAKAEAESAKAQAEAAKAQAEAAKAQAAAAEAAAKQKEAEAEAKKAEYESKGT